MHITEQKNELRRAIKERMEQLGADQRHAESRTLCRVLLPKLPTSGPICAYFPLKTEADMRPLFTELMKRGNTLYLPRFEDNSMVYRQADKLTDLPPGEFGIPEPPITNRLLGAEEATVILVPGRAFDRAGHRLGRGSGGFDKWISRQRRENPDTQFWGVCLQCQLVNHVPTEEHDEQMDAVITANEWVDLQ